MSEEEKLPTMTNENEDAVSFNTNKTQLLAFLIPVFFLIGLGAGYFIWGPGNAELETSSADNEILSRLENIEDILEDTLLSDDPTAACSAAQADVPPETPEEITRYDIEIYDDDPTLGPEDAPITIIEFSDYECPFCRRYNIETFDQIMATYEGQIRYIYKDFPLTSIHPNALSAASAALCAHEQDEFWDYHDKLFLMEMSLSKETYLQYAEDLELDMASFTECLEEGRFEDQVMADFDFAANLGISSTPTFFINGIPVVGAQPFEIFAQLINMELDAEN
jgi:protein-disulfide isomerase